MDKSRGDFGKWVKLSEGLGGHWQSLYTIAFSWHASQLDGGPPAPTCRLAQLRPCCIDGPDSDPKGDADNSVAQPLPEPWRPDQRVPGFMGFANQVFEVGVGNIEPDGKTLRTPEVIGHDWKTAPDHQENKAR